MLKHALAAALFLTSAGLYAEQYQMGLSRADAATPIETVQADQLGAHFGKSQKATASSSTKGEGVDVLDLDMLTTLGGILAFENEQQLDSALISISRMDREDLDAWEARVGFESQRNLFSKLVDVEDALDDRAYVDSGARPPEHTDLYYELLEYGIIKVVDEGTEGEYYDYGIALPGYEAVVNVDGLVIIGDALYQVTDSVIKKMVGGRTGNADLLMGAGRSDPRLGIEIRTVDNLKSTSQGCSPVVEDSGWDYSNDGKYRIKVSMTFTSSQYLSNGTMWKVTHNVNVKRQRKNWWGNWVYSWGEAWIAGDWDGRFRLEHPVYLNTFFDHYSAKYAYEYHPNSISNFNASISISSGQSVPYPSYFLYRYQYNGQYIRILDICLTRSYWKAEGGNGLRATFGSSYLPQCSLGSFDTANCHVGHAPAGSSAFIYAYNFYYTPLPQCTYPGSWYDGANCYVGTPPSGTTPFIWNGNWYYTPLAGNNCPYPGSWYDGANCYVGTPPSGTSPFVWSGNWYYNPEPTGCPLPDSWFDGANCFVSDIPNDSMPFIYTNGWYVTTYRD